MDVEPQDVFRQRIAAWVDVRDRCLRPGRFERDAKREKLHIAARRPKTRQINLPGIKAKSGVERDRIARFGIPARNRCAPLATGLSRADKDLKLKAWVRRRRHTLAPNHNDRGRWRFAAPPRFLLLLLVP